MMPTILRKPKQPIERGRCYMQRTQPKAHHHETPPPHHPRSPPVTTMAGNVLPPMLPTELLLRISTYLVAAAQLNSLLRTSRRFAQLCAPLLFERALTTVDARNARSVLHWAVATGRNRLLESLLAARTNINTMDNYGTAPLGSAELMGSKGRSRDFLKVEQQSNTRTVRGGLRYILPQ